MHAIHTGKHMSNISVSSLHQQFTWTKVCWTKRTIYAQPLYIDEVFNQNRKVRYAFNKTYLYNRNLFLYTRLGGTFTIHRKLLQFLKRRSTGNPWLVMAATCVVFISQAAASATRDKLHRQHHLVFRYTLYFQRRETTKWLSYNHMSALFANKSGCTAHNEATKVFSLYLVTRLSVSVRFHYTVMS